MVSKTTTGKNIVVVSILTAACACLTGYVVMAQAATNSCPVDGCEVKITSATTEGKEVRVVFDANFGPRLSKNHLHVWWGENFNVKQVTANAQGVFGVKQGVFHPIDDYPSYLTTGVVSASERGNAVTICVTAADRNHNILDHNLSDCRLVADLR